LARPISWVDFVPKFHRSVSESQRSLYDSGDLQRNLHVQPRTAQKLIGLMPRRQTGKLLQVERQDLAAFLECALAANKDGGDRALRKWLKEIEAAPPAIIKKKARGVLFQEEELTSMTSLPPSIRLVCGRLEIRFTEDVDLGQDMLLVAKLMANRDEFNRLYAVRERDSLPKAS